MMMADDRGQEQAAGGLSEGQLWPMDLWLNSAGGGVATEYKASQELGMQYYEFGWTLVVVAGMPET